MTTAVDASVVIASFASWHENHDIARRILDGGARLIEHGALETCSVLTRLPALHRASGEIVRAGCALFTAASSVELSGLSEIPVDAAR